MILIKVTIGVNLYQHNVANIGKNVGAYELTGDLMKLLTFMHCCNVLKFHLYISLPPCGIHLLPLKSSMVKVTRLELTNEGNIILLVFSEAV